jgi:hypothetical protein
MLSEEQLEACTQDLEAAIAALEESYGTERAGRREHSVELLPDEQRTKLEQAVGEPAATFWPKLQRAARKDICEKGAFIHDQWQQFATIAKKDFVKVSAGILTGMGLTGSSLLISIVPVGLWIFMALTHIGLKALCDAEETTNTRTRGRA